MTVDRTVDGLFREIQALSSELDVMDRDDPSRSELLATRDRLRMEARDLANSTRHPRSLEAEISMLVARLDKIDALFVNKGYAEKHLTKGFSDPGAYSADINRRLAEDYAPEISWIEHRLSELRAITPPQGDS
jgi:hypothetical protein